MDLAAPHLGYVAASYGLSAILIIGLVVHVIARDRALRAEAERLEHSRRKGGA
jgi:heme exporter protein CcmD